MNHKQPRRAALQPSRPSKLSLHRRGHSYSHPASTKPATSPRRSTAYDTANHAEELSDDDMAGLPQFCTTCEKQIITPGNSILYCSSACRKQDASRRVSIQTVLTTPTTIPSAASYFDFPPTNIVTPRSPTILRPSSLIFSEHPISESLPSDGDFESPADDESAVCSLPVNHFYSQSYSDDRYQHYRSKPSRHFGATEGLPSLSNTPGSSVGTAASIDHALNHRHNRSNGTSQTKSIDLVMPSFTDMDVANLSRSGEATSLASSASTRTVVRVADAGTFT